MRMTTISHMHSEPGCLINAMQAEDILGADMISTSEARKSFGLDTSAYRNLEKDLATATFRKQLIARCKGDYVLLPGFPMSIREIASAVLRTVFWGDDDYWFSDEQWAAEERVGEQWFLLRKNLVPGSSDIRVSYLDQFRFLREDERLPSASVLTYGMLLYYLTRRKRLYEGTYARCEDELDSDAQRRLHISIGWFDGKLEMMEYTGELRFPGRRFALGIAGVLSAGRTPTR